MVDTTGEKKRLAVFNKHIFLKGIIIVVFSSCSILQPKNKLLKSKTEIGFKYSNQITSTQLKGFLSVLASDEFEGRETTYPGQKKAAQYLKDKLIEWNVSPAQDNGKYFQEFKVMVQDFSNVSLIINDDTLTFIKDFYSFGNPEKTNYTNVGAVFAGHGIINEYFDSYQTIDVKDKVVILKEGTPTDKNFPLKDANWRKKVKSAKSKGAIAVFFIKEDYNNTDLGLKAHLKNPSMKMHNKKKTKAQIPVFFISQKYLNSNINNVVSFSTNVNQLKTAENVLGYIPGNTDEIIVVSAHYDHIGYDQGEICNGADDDGSGTAALLSLLQTFQKAHDNGLQPQRGILFLMVSGEEKGLFGSKFYTENPVFPLNKTIANLNIDMVGRKDTIQPNNNYIYLIGSDKISNQLHNINEQINDKYVNFRLDYTYNDENDPNQYYYRSDHYNFAKNDIPVIFYFGGMHEDYHKPTDDIEKIDFNKLEKISRFIFLTAWELAHRKKRIK